MRGLNRRSGSEVDRCRGSGCGQADTACERRLARHQQHRCERRQAFSRSRRDRPDRALPRLDGQRRQDDRCQRRGVQAAEHRCPSGAFDRVERLVSRRHEDLEAAVVTAAGRWGTRASRLRYIRAVGRRSGRVCGSFDAPRRTSLPCRLGLAVALPRRPLLCARPKALWRSSHTDCQPTRAERSYRAEGEGEDPCAPRRAAEARRLHARVYDHAEEAELGAAEGRPRPADERHGSRRLHPRRGPQPPGALGRADPRRPRQGPPGLPLQGDPGRARLVGRRRPQAGPLQVRRQAGSSSAAPCRDPGPDAGPRPRLQLASRHAGDQPRDDRREALDRREDRLRRARQRRRAAPASRRSRCSSRP